MGNSIGNPFPAPSDAGCNSRCPWPAGLPTSLGECLHKRAAVGLVEKAGFTKIAADQQVADGERSALSLMRTEALSCYPLTASSPPRAPKDEGARWSSAQSRKRSSSPPPFCKADGRGCVGRVWGRCRAASGKTASSKLQGNIHLQHSDERRRPQAEAAAVGD